MLPWPYNVLTTNCLSCGEGPGCILFGGGWNLQLISDEGAGPPEIRSQQAPKRRGIHCPFFLFARCFLLDGNNVCFLLNN